MRTRENRWGNMRELSYESQSLPVFPTNSNISHYACHLNIYTHKVGEANIFVKVSKSVQLFGECSLNSSPRTSRSIVSLFKGNFATIKCLPRFFLYRKRVSFSFTFVFIFFLPYTCVCLLPYTILILITDSPHLESTFTQWKYRGR